MKIGLTAGRRVGPALEVVIEGAVFDVAVNEPRFVVVQLVHLKLQTEHLCQIGLKSGGEGFGFLGPKRLLIFKGQVAVVTLSAGLRVGAGRDDHELFLERLVEQGPVPAVEAGAGDEDLEPGVSALDPGPQCLEVGRVAAGGGAVVVEHHRHEPDRRVRPAHTCLRVGRMPVQEGRAPDPFEQNQILRIEMVLNFPVIGRLADVDHSAEPDGRAVAFGRYETAQRHFQTHFIRRGNHPKVTLRFFGLFRFVLGLRHGGGRREQAHQDQVLKCSALHPLHHTWRG